MEEIPSPRVMVICLTPVYMPSSNMVPPVPPHGPNLSGVLIVMVPLSEMKLGNETVCRARYISNRMVN
jgi:hypothetical protein